MAITNNDRKGTRKEGFCLGSKFEELDTGLTDVSKSVCKLKIEVNSEIQYGTGFLLRYPIDGKHFTCLLSNGHIIKEEFIKNKFIMNMPYNYDNKSIIIKLDENERYIRGFKNIGLDITLVEILNSDDIYEDYFLFQELDFIIKDLKNKQIYRPQFQLGKKIENALGIIKNIDKYHFTYLVSDNSCLSGSPIILFDTKKVIGIHKQSNNRLSEKDGDLIYHIFNLIKKDIEKIKRISNKRNKKIRDKPKNSYKKDALFLASIIIFVISIIIFCFKKISPNSKRKLYYPNGKIKYIGNIKRNKLEGRGIFYYKNGDIAYEGDFVNNKFEGKGILFNKKGNIGYKGDFVNNKFEGKGILYDDNGNILYEGNFVNNEFKGKEISYNENKNIDYENEMKNDFSDGKGKEYYVNRTIKNEEYFFDENII